MGSRANYIVKSKNQFEIYYTHWRASDIAKDLYLGYKKFKSFIQQFDKVDTLLDYPWIEGCVLIDEDEKRVTFWGNFVLEEYSVTKEYLRILRERWGGWEVECARKEMYDIEKILSVDYMANQETFFEEYDFDLNKLAKAIEEKYEYSDFLLIKENEDVKVISLGAVSSERVLQQGKETIPILKSLSREELFNESEFDLWGGVAVDLDNKIVYYNECSPGFFDLVKYKWEGWKIKLESYKYLEVVEKLGGNLDELELSAEEVENVIDIILNGKDDFDPVELGEKLSKEMEDVEFHPNFFENIKPDHKSGKTGFGILSWLKSIWK